MSNNNEKLADVLNDLIRINHDRMKGYETSRQETEKIGTDLQQTFQKMAEQSRKYAAQLSSEVLKYGGEATDGSTAGGAIHRAWIDVKTTFTGKDRHAILSSCEFGEDAAQKAYKEALESDAQIPADTRQLITEQKDELKSSHDMIKKYRDAAKEVNA